MSYKKISSQSPVGICKCIYKHIPLDELNTTLEIVFSTQIYLTISVDGVRCVFLQLTCLQASSLEFPGDCLMGGRRGKTFVSALRLSFLYKQAGCLLNSGRCLSLCQLRKFCYSWMLVPGSETAGQPKYHRAGKLCDPLLQSVPSLPQSDMQT